MHGTKASNLGVTKCDLLIAIGARFSDRVIGNPRNFARNAKILHIDVDAAEINKNVLVDCSVIGDAKEVLKQLNHMVPAAEHKEWLETIEELKEKYPLSYHQEGLTGPGIIEELYKQTNGEAIIVTEVGQHQMWAAQYYKYTMPRTFLSSGGLGTMGYGLGAAIGAKMGNPDKVVINVAGDGCFRMNMNEIATATRNDLPLIQVVVNNQVLGMVRQWQTAFYGKRFSQTDPHRKTNFVKLAEGFGLKGYHCENLAQFQEAFADALKQKGPTWIECMIDKDEKVLPMIPGGGDINDIIMK